MDKQRISDFEARSKEYRSSGFLSEIALFLWETKKWWMVPIIVTLVLLGIVIYLSSSAAAPFIYTLF